MLGLIRNPLALSLIAVGLWAADPVSAAVFHASTTGSDAAAGSAAAPVKTLAKALTLAADSDTIILRDPGDYGAGIISKSITILSPHGGGTFAPNSPCLTINAGTTGSVVIDGYLCDMDGKSNHGILVNSAHRLLLNNVVVRNGSGTSCGLRTVPSGHVLGMQIKDSIFGPYGSQSNNTVGAVCLQPSGTSGAVGGTLNRVTILNGANGLLASPIQNLGNIDVTLVDAVITRNGRGISATSANSFVRVSNSAIVGNGTGLSTTNGGNIISLEGNSLSNIVNGAFSATIAKQ